MSTRKNRLNEVVGDYSMVAGVRYAAPGNIRADMYVKGSGGNVLSDERAESDAEEQEQEFDGLDEVTLRECVRLIAINLLRN